MPTQEQMERWRGKWAGADMQAAEARDRLAAKDAEIRRLRRALDKIIGIALGSRMDPDFPAAKVHKTAHDALNGE